MLQSFRVESGPTQQQLLIFDSVLDGKHVYTACGTVDDVDGEMEMPDTARATLLALVQHAEGACNGGVRLVPVGDAIEALAVVRDTLEQAADKDIVFFCCFGPEAYEAAVSELNPVYATGQRITQ